MTEERVKRKQRGSERMARGYAKAEERNQEAREALQPLAEGERPTVVTLGAIVAALIVVSIVVGYAAGAKVNGEQPKLAQVVAPAVIMGMMAWGMWHARYWAVLGFQLVLVIVSSAPSSGSSSAPPARQILGTLPARRRRPSSTSWSRRWRGSRCRPGEAGSGRAEPSSLGASPGSPPTRCGAAQAAEIAGHGR